VVKSTVTLARAAGANLFLPRTFGITGSGNVLVRARFYLASQGESQPDEFYVERAFATPLSCGPNKATTIELESDCTRTDSLSIGGAATPCQPGTTCRRGACVSDALAPSEVRTVDPKVKPGDDVCTLGATGAPQLTIGAGQTDYLPLAASPVLASEAGPQGGHHIWVAVRMRGLAQAGTVVTLNASQPGGVKVRPYQVVFNLSQDEGGYCKLYGLRLQLDTESPISAFYNKPLLIQAEARDGAGRSATATATVTVGGP
jgi:hypothetical protein